MGIRRGERGEAATKAIEFGHRKYHGGRSLRLAGFMRWLHASRDPFKLHFPPSSSSKTVIIHRPNTPPSLDLKFPGTTPLGARNMSVINTPQPWLLTLPAERHLSIASHLSWWDVYALRLSCRQLHALIPPLTTLPQYNGNWKQYWWFEPLKASFLVLSNNLKVCDRCPTIENTSDAPFITWVEQGLYDAESKSYVRKYPDRPAEVWNLCEICDKNLEGNQNHDWCCRWTGGMKYCGQCCPQMQRI